MNRKEDVLRLLKSTGLASLADVAQNLGLTKQGALRHLDALQAEGLVETVTIERAGPGRRSHAYRLTAAADDHFPAAYRQLASELVDFIESDQLERFFRARAARVEAEYAARLAGLDFQGRVRELARLASEHGHMTEVVEHADGTVGLRHCNCPIQDLAAKSGHPCRQERDMYQRLLGADLTRSTWLGAGDASCTYSISTKEGN